MNAIKRLIKKRQGEMMEKLQASGMDYDDAWATVMTFGSRVEGMKEDDEKLPADVEAVLNEIRQQVMALRARESAKKEEGLEAAVARIRAGNHTNADLALVVEAGLAFNMYDDPQSNRPTGIQWGTAGDTNPYADQVERV